MKKFLTKIWDCIPSEIKFNLDIIIGITILIVLGLCCGCASMTKDDIPSDALKPSYDVNSLKDTDRTYNIISNHTITVTVSDKPVECVFNDNWYIVHKDWIKKFNENQDALLEILQESNDKKKLTLERIPVGFLCIIIVLVLLIILSSKLITRKDNGK